MAIGRSEDRDTPWDPMVLRHHFSVWDPIRVTHLGQRSSDRATKAGHMTATDQSHCSRYILARRGPSTYGSPQPAPTSSQRNTSGPAAWKRWARLLRCGRDRSAAGFRMLVMSRIRHAAIVPFPDNRSEPAKTERPKYPENGCRTTIAERMGGNASGTALYRESGRLFRPRPGPLKRTCINEVRVICSG